MKSEIDQLMKDNGIEALLIVGPAQHNPAMFYLTGGGHITNADLIKKQGETPVIFHGSMERDEAAKTGLRTCSYDKFPFSKYLKEAGNNQIEAQALRYRDLFLEAGVEKGKIALYGSTEIGAKFSVLNKLQQLFPVYEITGLIPDTILLTAMMKNFYNHIIKKVSEVFTDIPIVSRMKRFIFRFICVAGKWVRQSRQWKLRLYTERPYEKLVAS